MNLTQQQISIIGCGWLGFPLAQQLLKEGFSVKGSTTTPGKLSQLRTAGIKSYTLKLNTSTSTEQIIPVLKNSNAVIVNIPPGLRRLPNKNHVEEIEQLVDAIVAAHVPHVLFVSSTSVYKNECPIPTYTESNAPNSKEPSGVQLKTIEAMLHANLHFRTTVVRFGGLIDDERHPAKYLSGKSNLKNPEAPINLIHKVDAINILIKILKEAHWQETFNAVYPRHPSRENFYTSHCKSQNLPLPEFNTSGVSVGKIIRSEKLVQLLNYNYIQSP